MRVSVKEIKNALQIFPLGATGGPDDISAQHMKNLLAEAPDDKLLDSMTQFIKLMPAGSFSIAMNEINVCVRLIALEKNDDGGRPNTYSS